MSKKFDMHPHTWSIIKDWVDEGNRVGVWQNVDLGHPELGHTVCCKVGEFCTYKTDDDVPKRMPDGAGGVSIAWRYQLQGVFGAEDFNNTFVLDSTEEENQTQDTRAGEKLEAILKKQEEDKEWDEALEDVIREFNPSAQSGKQDDPPEEEDLPREGA